MKVLQPLKFDLRKCRNEVAQFRGILDKHSQLEERRHILPFFRKRRHLSAFIASCNPTIIRFDRIAFEYPLFGDLTCDLVVGDSVKRAFSFVEFEDASARSLFVKKSGKATREWSPRFQHGYSQIIDWFCRLADAQKTDDFAARFGARSIGFTGILVVGRDRYLQPGERDRLDWWRRNVIVGSQNIQCVTFDGLLEDLEARLQTFSLSARAGG